ncbi:hypothetical protein VFPFJ_02520 [Purpureocillium lilacinum]|uniref:Uncharacterized protein n=1 Tax=Purpureocillium lilacinum TaxID=33203 RepID=A0A179HV41_PURLI|nr:hypothetical protein VFPFJ_02520 [Purpureocillium lilacinum]OAQ93358.1 hypothetical protein VFPFJ_02520 [Purpureocillium lilacinum]
MSWPDRSRPTKAHITISCVNTADSRVTTSAGICDPSPIARWCLAAPRLDSSGGRPAGWGARTEPRESDRQPGWRRQKPSKLRSGTLS